MSSTLNSEDLLFDFDAISPEAIELDSTEIDRALQLSNRASGTDRQWQMYLNALALLGCERWFADRAEEITFDSTDASLFQPQYDRALDAVCNVSVGEFKLCILPVSNVADETISIPRAAIDLAEFTAHFYVLVEVQEESDRVTVCGYLRHDRLVQLQQELNLQPEADWTYAVPLDCFDLDPDRLLLYVRCLEPSAIALPAIPENRPAQWLARQTELTALFPQLQAGERPWWQILTWEQATALLTQPDWLESLERLQSGSLTLASLGDRLAEIGQRIALPAVNAARWLNDELDRWAQEASWMLLPTLAPATAMLRSTTEELDTILVQLERIGMSIAPQARGVYQNLQLADVSMRLYAVTWEILTHPDEPEWSLLLILSAPTGKRLPGGTTLRVCDETGILVKRTLADDSEENTLYIRTIGSWHETFSVTISLDRGVTITLPPFAFQPDR